MYSTITLRVRVVSGVFKGVPRKEALLARFGDGIESTKTFTGGKG